MVPGRAPGRTAGRTPDATDRLPRGPAPGRAAGRPLRLHRPHPDRPRAGPRADGGSGDHRPAARTAPRGPRERQGRAHRHGRTPGVRGGGGPRRTAGDGIPDRVDDPRAGGGRGPRTDRGRLPARAQALRTVQGTLLDEVFSELEASRSGRHTGPVVGEGAVEMERTRPYEFGDSGAHLNIPQTLVNAAIRSRSRGEGSRSDPTTSRSTRPATTPRPPAP